MHKPETLPEYPSTSVLNDDDVRLWHTRAVASLSRLDGVLEALPNSGVLLESVPLTEARDSCGIENILTSADDAYRALTASEGATGAAVREVVNYRGAMDVATGGVLSVQLTEDVCSVVKGRRMTVRGPGEQVHLKDSEGGIVRTPPSGDDVQGLMQELLDRIGGYDDPLLRMAVFHLMFETIHPFMDGNGRTGRILNDAVLVQSGLVSRPVLFISGFLNRNRRYYYRFMLQVQRRGLWEPYLAFMFQAVAESAERTEKTVLAVRDEYERFAGLTSDLLFCDRRLLDVLFSHVYTKIPFLVDAGICSRNSASRYLIILEERGLLRSEKVGRERLYLNTGLFEILRN